MKTPRAFALSTFGAAVLTIAPLSPAAAGPHWGGGRGFHPFGLGGLIAGAIVRVATLPLAVPLAVATVAAAAVAGASNQYASAPPPNYQPAQPAYYPPPAQPAYYPPAAPPAYYAPAAQPAYYPPPAPYYAGYAPGVRYYPRAQGYYAPGARYNAYPVYQAGPRPVYYPYRR